SLVGSGITFELHPDLDLGGKSVLRLDSHQLGVVFTEGVLRLQKDRAALADFFLSQSRFDLGKDAVVPAVEVGDRLRGFLDQIAVGGKELVRQSDDRVGKDIQAGAS